MQAILYFKNNFLLTFTHHYYRLFSMNLPVPLKLRGYFAVGLDNPKTSQNIASVLRACDCYGAAMVAVSGTRYQKHACDTSKAYRRIPFLQVDDLKNVIPYDCIPVAVELVDGAESLINFYHPERAFYVFGAEDNTLDQRVLSWCVRKVMVPTRICMNLGACVNVVLYDRLQKQLRSFTKGISV
jgi:tRNA(Leu) C34 or U34 (ribose-2'-O)-methylase TrmL